VGKPSDTFTPAGSAAGTDRPLKEDGVERGLRTKPGGPLPPCGPLPPVVVADALLDQRNAANNSNVNVNSL